jgi:hypothetical protein
MAVCVCLLQERYVRPSGAVVCGRCGGVIEIPEVKKDRA